MRKFFEELGGQPVDHWSDETVIGRYKLGDGRTAKEILEERAKRSTGEKGEDPDLI